MDFVTKKQIEETTKGIYNGKKITGKAGNPGPSGYRRDTVDKVLKEHNNRFEMKVNSHLITTGTSRYYSKPIVTITDTYYNKEHTYEDVKLDGGNETHLRQILIDIIANDRESKLNKILN